MATPSAATARNSISASVTTSPPLAPERLQDRQRGALALDEAAARRWRRRRRRRRAKSARPAPETRRNGRGCAKIRARRSSATRASQPASGKAALASATSAATSASLGGRALAFISNARRPADQRARLNEAARAQGVDAKRARARQSRCRCRAGPARRRRGRGLSSWRSPRSKASPTFRFSRSSSASSTAAP